MSSSNVFIPAPPPSPPTPIIPPSGSGFDWKGLLGSVFKGVGSGMSQNGGSVTWDVAKAGITAGASYGAGALAGAQLGSIIPGIGTVAGAVIGTIVGGALKKFDAVWDNGGNLSCIGSSNSPAKARREAPAKATLLMQMAGFNNHPNAETLNRTILYLRGYAAGEVDGGDWADCTKEGNKVSRDIIEATCTNLIASYSPRFVQVMTRRYAPGEFHLVVNGSERTNHNGFTVPIYRAKNFGESVSDMLTPGNTYNPTADNRYGNLPDGIKPGYVPTGNGSSDNSLFFIAGLGALGYFLFKKK